MRRAPLAAALLATALAAPALAQSWLGNILNTIQPPFAHPQSQRYNLLDQINRARYAGDLKRAVELAESLVASDWRPGSGTGVARQQSAQLCAQLQRQAGNSDRALELYRMVLADVRAMGIPMASIGLLQEIGKLQEERGDVRAAAATYRDALRDAAPDPSGTLRASLLESLGWTLLKLDDLDAAHPVMAEALALQQRASIQRDPNGNSWRDIGAIGDQMAMVMKEKALALSTMVSLSDATGQVVTDPKASWRASFLDLRDPFIGMAELHFRRRDRQALADLYRTQFLPSAALAGSPQGSPFSAAGKAKLELAYARFGAYLAGLQLDDLAQAAFDHALQLNADRLRADLANPGGATLLAGQLTGRRQLIGLALSFRVARHQPLAQGPIGQLMEVKGTHFDHARLQARAARQSTSVADRLRFLERSRGADDRILEQGPGRPANAASLAPMAPGAFLDQLQRGLGERTLVSIAGFDAFDFAKQAFGGQRYLGVRIDRTGTRAADLGPADAIDVLAARLRDELSRPPKAGAPQRPASGKALYTAVLQPLFGATLPSGAYVVDPDGALQVVPFEALVEANGRFVIERGDWSYVGSPRAVIAPTAAGSGGAALVLGDPDYDTRGVGTVPGAAPPRQFRPLANTRAEADAVARLLGQSGNRVSLLSGQAATVAALTQQRAPRFLHLATHGFFLDDLAWDKQARQAADGRQYTIETYARGWSTGLALAGANGGRDGILFAAQLRQLDLEGTELAVLSACDTAFGVTRDGEGVDSLLQALHVAGARSTVTTLWPVVDDSTRELMTAFYTGIGSGQAKGAALRQAKLALARNKPHPYYWAAFIYSGEP